MADKHGFTYNLSALPDGPRSIIHKDLFWKTFLRDVDRFAKLGQNALWWSESTTRSAFLSTFFQMPGLSTSLKLLEHPVTLKTKALGRPDLVLVGKNHVEVIEFKVKNKFELIDKHGKYLAPMKYAKETANAADEALTQAQGYSAGVKSLLQSKGKIVTTSVVFRRIFSLESRFASYSDWYNKSDEWVCDSFGNGMEPYFFFEAYRNPKPLRSEEAWWFTAPHKSVDTNKFMLGFHVAARTT